MILLLLACSAAGDSAAPVTPSADCARALTWQNYGDGFFASYCRSCHSATAADRHGATEGLNFDTEADVLAAKAAVTASIEGATMPPGGGLVADDVTLILEWLSCGD